MSSASNFTSMLVGGRLDYPFMPAKTKPYIEGIIIDSDSIGKKENVIGVTEKRDFLSVAVGVSNYEPRDYWNLYVGNELVCKNVYTKDVPEGMYFTAVMPVDVGDTIQIEFFNHTGKQKYVWVNYQFLK